MTTQSLNNTFAHDVFASFVKSGKSERDAFALVATRLNSFDLTSDEGKAAYTRAFNEARNACVAARLVAHGHIKSEAKAFDTLAGNVSALPEPEKRAIKAALQFWNRQRIEYDVVTLDARGGAANGAAGGAAKAESDKAKRAPHHNAPAKTNGDIAPPAAIKAVVAPTLESANDTLVFARDLAALCSRVRAKNAKRLTPAERHWFD
ncbi:MAG: hypothetical protein P4L81_07970, partial [Candidatus Pacebacteria bacterium]|nr:hypothetical protein [Candidatus Paceibacterota bacterium]